MKVKDWEEIQSDFKRMNEMSCIPSFERLKSGYITDENKSVKWNREQVELNHENYQKELARLQTEKNKTRDAVFEDIYTKIQDEVGYNLNKKSAIKIWNLAYENGHAYGFLSIKYYLEDYMDLARTILMK